MHQVREDVAGFFRRLRAATGGKAFPYLWVAEWHPGGHGLHLHFAVGRFIRVQVIREAWGLGFVGIKQLGDLPVGSGALGESRLAARYLAKYVSKTLDGSGAGLHRYEVAQGFQPRRLRVEGRSEQEVIGQACHLFGSDPERVWRSQDEKDWHAPPAVWAQWAA